MHERTISLLSCPVCRRILSFDGTRADGRFSAGLLRCSSGHIYQVKEEMGMLKDAKLSAKEFQWKVDVADEKKYDEIRKEYDSYFRNDHLTATRKMKEQLVRLVVDSCAKSDNVALDIATGMGTFLLSLAEKSPSDALLLGTDIDEKPLRGTMNKAKKAESYSKMSLVVTDAKRLCFRNSILSTISSYFGFDNIPKTVLALKESARVLRPSGKAIFSSLWYKENSESMRLAEKHSVNQIASEARLKKALEKTGLVLEHVEEVYSDVWPHNPMDMLPVEGDEYSYVIVTAKKPKL